MVALSSSPSLGQLPRVSLLFLTLAHFFTATTAQDGKGMIGGGRTLFKPVCAHTCRSFISKSPILCDSKIPDEPPTTDDTNPFLCYSKDAAFLRTLALCLEDHCQREKLPVSSIEKYWERKTAFGIPPIMTYEGALRHAHEDLQEFDEADVPYLVEGAPLNTTHRVPEEEWMLLYNYMRFFDNSYTTHGYNSIAVAVSSVFIPILFSLFRFLPGRPLWYSRLEAILEKPLFGHRHRTPMAGDIGIMPTRGQSLYIAYLLITQIFLAIFPLTIYRPAYNSFGPPFSAKLGEFMNAHPELQIIGDRTGVIAMADFVALFLFSSRNNILLWITGWSHGTFLLLHRWLGYCTIIQTCLHSLLLAILYGPDHSYQSQRPFWIWGIVGTLAFVVIWPVSVLQIRKRYYEFFLIFHQVFTALGLIATFFHIYAFFKYTWGYEIWVYIAGIIWFLDRFIRLMRMAVNGYRTAVVTAVDSSGEYFCIEIDGVVVDGHAYLSFPTLAWRFWESHPFSVLSSVAVAGDTPARSKDKAVPGDTKASGSQADPEKTSQSSSASSSLSSRTGRVCPRATILFRSRDGITKTIADRVQALAQGQSLSLPVLVESSYRANPSIRNLSGCTTLLCIAGGVGVTAVLPIIKTFGGGRTRFVWGLRNESLLHALQPDLTSLGPGVHVETSVGARLNVREILEEELERDDEGELGIVVCGPAGMADDARNAISELGSKAKRGVVFVDEAFSW
ncbi:metalloreductase [Coprinopsis cinerea AmutBmut pab1-1]|nr:metalloreductase [Coprinopsis cinerea AmutBmut pab1-1]